MMQLYPISKKAQRIFHHGNKSFWKRTLFISVTILPCHRRKYICCTVISLKNITPKNSDDQVCTSSLMLFKLRTPKEVEYISEKVLYRNILMAKHTGTYKCTLGCFNMSLLSGGLCIDMHCQRTYCFVHL